MSSENKRKEYYSNSGSEKESENKTESEKESENPLEKIERDFLTFNESHSASGDEDVLKYYFLSFKALLMTSSEVQTPPPEA